MKRLFYYLRILISDTQNCDLFRHASGMAYVTLFSLVPSLACVFALISLFEPMVGDKSSLIAEAKNFILHHLAQGSGENLVNYIETFISNLDMKKIGLSGIIGLLFTLTMLLRQIELAFNKIWQVEKERHLLIRFVYFWTFLTLGAFLIPLAIGLISGFNLSHMNPFAKNISESHGFLFLGYIGSLAVQWIIFFLLYKITPNCLVSNRAAMWGAFSGLLLFELSKSFYGFYTSRFYNYENIYGTLAAVPIFLLWLYVNWLVVLIGSLISWRVEQGWKDGYLNYLTDAKSASEKLRNHQLKALLPLGMLIRIYLHFKESKTKGLSLKEIYRGENFPRTWIDDALLFLIEKKMIIKQSTVQENFFLESDEFYPTSPSDNYTIGEILNLLIEKSSEFFNANPQTSVRHFFPLLKKLDEKTLKENFSSLI